MRKSLLLRRNNDIESIICYVIIAIVSVLLFLRDAAGYSVNKYLFLLILGPALIFMNERNMYKLWAFIMPLYVGLPGNFLTLIILIRFILLWLKNKTVHLATSQFVLTVILCLFIFVQNLLMDMTLVYHMIYVIEYIVLYFIMSLNSERDICDIFLFYSWGIALVGSIMLLYTLRFTSLSELTRVSTRLGAYGRTNAMTVIIDPNYYGLFSLTSIAGNWCLIRKGRYSKIGILLAILAASIALCISIIGLSRAFIICLAIWFILALFTEKKIVVKLGLVAAISVIAVVAFTLVPESIEALFERFQSDDMTSGNGRIDLLVEWMGEWAKTPISMLFGVGLFRCNVHCMHVQFWTGLGVIGFTLFISLMFSYMSVQKKGSKKPDLSTLVPFAVVQISSATIPIAQSMTFMMPMIMSILIYREANRYSRK